MTRLLLLALALYVLPARADCTCTTDGNGDCMQPGPVTCDAVTFNGLAHVAQQAEHDLAVAQAATERCEFERDAARDRVRALEALPAPEPPSVLPWVALGGAAGALVVTGLVVLLHGL